VALSDDQKAILRLLSQRGAQGYEDLSALLGVSVAEVHSRAKAAAAQLESEGIPAPPVPEPSGATAPPPTAPQEPQEPAPEVVHSTEAPRAHAPKPALPPGKPKPPLRRELKLLEGRGLWALLAGAAIVVLFVVIILTGGGDDGGDSTTTSSSAASGETVAALEKAAEGGSKEVTKASLQAVDGSDAVGVAIFGRVKKNLALQIAAEGLEPAEGEDGYTIWLAASPQKMLPLASTEVGEDGRIGAQVTVPVEVLAYLADETFRQITITRTDESQLRASLAEATKEKDAPAYTGDEVLNGEVTGPIVGAANRTEESEEP
jgi:hypothetical protein